MSDLGQLHHDPVRLAVLISDAREVSAGYGLIFNVCFGALVLNEGRHGEIISRADPEGAGW